MSSSSTPSNVPSNNGVVNSSPITLPKKSQLTRTFHRRLLPKSCIALSSPEGKKLFASAHANGGLKSFFELMEHFLTQSEPAYCGISTLVMTLNALAVDPRVTWKGPWRWYEESMLNCCIDLELAKETGITLPTFLCLAKCQGLKIEDKLAKESSVEEFRSRVIEACVESRHTDEEGVGGAETRFDTSECACFKTMAEESNKVLIVSYNRRTFGQTGSGHFSPIGAYDPVSDHVLILDVARFKYGPHWVPLRLMFDAMIPEDPDTKRSRGFVSFSFSEGLLCCQEQLLPQSRIFESISSNEHFCARKKYNETILSKYSPLNDTTDTNQALTFQEVVNFWCTYDDNKKAGGVWDIIEPQLIPVDATERQYAMDLIDLLKFIVDTYNISAPCSLNNDYCLKSLNRKLPIRPVDAMFVIYLSSLSSREERSNAIYEIEKSRDPNDKLKITLMEQILMEAELVRLAIDNSPEKTFSNANAACATAANGCSKCGNVVK